MVTRVSFVFANLIRPLVLGNLYPEHLAVERLIRESNLEAAAHMVPNGTNP